MDALFFQHLDTAATFPSMKLYAQRCFSRRMELEECHEILLAMELDHKANKNRDLL